MLMLRRAASIARAPDRRATRGPASTLGGPCGAGGSEEFE